jgi:hypothetical protein
MKKRKNSNNKNSIYNKSITVVFADVCKFARRSRSVIRNAASFGINVI